ncbi:hypothetical protein N7931_02505 [Catenovulum sp. 2E275]|uniref:hypothetical protein n=1 Tax=Catenovulum sp. 2E275 TaxID=2980497 RepID=UPI0021D034A6|nr:hypothetical protein [Catenovulum sp. 2E275]MCU4674493.1 hypothetical protein [Catenovulum sp. 2E275]
MPELLFLLLPVAALYGYVMGRNSYRQSQLKQHEKINQDFLSGLNLFLSNQRDKAINVLIENLEVNNETFTTHIALGKLFRAKGENDRAIKIHQFLAQQDVLTPEQRRQSIIQLARDYVDCALYDRAEKLLLPLLEDKACAREARLILSRIYQTFKDWQQAFDAIEPIETQDGEPYQVTKAYLLCELASEKATHEKIAMLKQALSYDKKCARAYLDLIDCYIELRESEQANQLSRVFADTCPDFIALLVPRLAAVFPDDAIRLDFLISISGQIKSTSVVAAIADIMERQDRVGDARKSVLGMLDKHATISGFAQLLKLNAKKTDAPEAQQMMLNLEKMVVNKVKQLPSYECEQCGYQGSLLFWQCPRCKHWGSVKPIIGLTGD